MVRLQIKDLTFYYDGVCALENITFDAKEGELLGIIGPNGSGKTTLLKCINRVLKPVSGAILFDDIDLSSLERKEIAKIVGVVPQISKIFPFVVLDVILMGRYPHLTGLGGEKASDFEAVKKAMVLTGVSHLSERFTDELSGGESKK